MSSLQEQARAFQKDLIDGGVDVGFIGKLEEAHQELYEKLDAKKLLFDRDEFNFADHEAIRKIGERFTGIYNTIKGHKHFEALFRDMSAYGDVSGFFLNTSAFLKTIEMLGDDEQVKEWRSKTLAGQVVGCYAQTELGHGSNVQGLETEAHYDTATKTFTFKSPTSSSSKYWPGLLGMFSTHAVLQAQTYVNGKHIGVQTFVVPLRDWKLKPFDRVDVGDMGSKFGMNRLDHGYLLFNDYVLPRSAMLARYIRIDDQGKVHGLDNRQNLKYGYGSMLNLRVLLTSVFGASLLKFTQRFMTLESTKGTLKDARVQRNILENLCGGCGILLANKNTQKEFIKFTAHLRNKEFEQADQLLNECHVISSTFKAVTSWKMSAMMVKLMEFSRDSVLRSSDLTRVYTDSFPAVTYEGDNTVLLQLTAKHLLKQEPGTSPKPGAIVDPQSIDSMLAAAAYVSEQEVQRVRNALGKAMESGKEMEAIWSEDLQRDLVDMSIVWGQFKLIQSLSLVLKGPAYQQSIYRKIAIVFVGQILMEMKRLPFYGLKFEPIDIMTVFSEDEKTILMTPFDPFLPNKPYVLNSEYLDKKGARLLQIAGEQLRAKL